MSAILSVWFLGEKIVWKYDMMAFVMISTGTIAVVLISKETEAELTTEDIVAQLSSVKVILLIIVYFAAIIGNYLLSIWFNRQVRLFEIQGVNWA